MMKAFDISSSAMTLQRLRMDIIAQNIANANTTRTDNGLPYRRKLVVAKEDKGIKPFGEFLSESNRKYIGNGVKAIATIEDNSPFKIVYDPGHPDADADGYVELPNVDTVKEMVDMISATRSFEANVTVFNASKSIAIKALEIGR